MSEQRSGGRLPRTVRILLLIVLALGVLWLLFTVIFPWVEQRMNDPTLEGAIPAVVALAVP